VTPTDHLTVGAEALDLGVLERKLEDQACGGLACFVGRVRDEHRGRPVLRLDYEAHPLLALAEMRSLAMEARLRWSLGPLLMAHRTGQLRIGDTAVIVGVAGGHRGECFEACRFLIEGIKERVPVWKHEFYADGSDAWVGAPGWDPAAKDLELGRAR
jgi:molybdopterin synthase catalytic subunit